MRQLIRACPPGFELVLADVGSAGGIKDRWKPARSVVSGLLFEPRDDGEPRQQGRDILYPVALGRASGRATLNLTRLPNMSSTLMPNSALLRTFRNKGRNSQVTGTIEMPVETLDALAAREGRRIDAIKIDTQGSELGILQGAETCLAETIFIAEVEVSFLERYEGQPLLRDIESFMAERGFELLDLYRIKRYRRINGAKVGNVSVGGGQRAGRIAYGDALFVTREEKLLERIEAEGETLALKVLVALGIYGKVDIAAAIFDQVAHVVEPPRRAQIERYFRSLAGVRRKALHKLLDYLARNV